MSRPYSKEGIGRAVTPCHGRAVPCFNSSVQTSALDYDQTPIVFWRTIATYSVSPLFFGRHS